MPYHGHIHSADVTISIAGARRRWTRSSGKALPGQGIRSSHFQPTRSTQHARREPSRLAADFSTVAGVRQRAKI